MQLRYEILILTLPDINQEHAKNIEKSLSDAVSNCKGSVLSYERWGKYQLAYPVKKQDYGIYYLMRFEVPSATDVIKDIKSLFAIRLGSHVMRYIISVLDPKRPLEYQRPRSLEEAPTAREMASDQNGREFQARGRRNGSFDRSDRHQERPARSMPELSEASF